jgi:hypothetical protein
LVRATRATSVSNAVSIGSGRNQPLTGNIFEVGVWTSDKSSNFSTMNSNKHTYWNF